MNDPDYIIEAPNVPGLIALVLCVVAVSAFAAGAIVAVRALRRKIIRGREFEALLNLALLGVYRVLAVG